MSSLRELSTFWLLLTSPLLLYPALCFHPTITHSSHAGALQCACPSDSTGCPEYDRQLMASDLVEAVRNFPDLTLPEPEDPWDYEDDEDESDEKTDEGTGFPHGTPQPASVVHPPPKPGPGGGGWGGGSAGGSSWGGPGGSKGSKANRRRGDYKCHGSKCKTCSRELVDRLSQTGWMDSDEKSRMESRLGISSYEQNQRNCGRMQMHRGTNPYHGKGKGPGGKGPGGRPPPGGGGRHGGRTGGRSPFGGGSPPRRRDLNNGGGIRGTSGNTGSRFGGKSAYNWRNTGGGPGQWNRLGAGIEGRKNRHRRQTTTVIGQRKTLFCIERGSPVKDGSEWITLCHYCWAWRKLPSDYNPTYINELVCNEEQGDSKCLSKHGTCQQIWRSVDVLKKNGNEWVTESIRVGTSCACQITPDSQAFNLVTGKGFQNG